MRRWRSSFSIRAARRPPVNTGLPCARAIAAISSAPADAPPIRSTASQRAEQPPGDRVEDLVEHRVADPPAPGQLDQRQRERLAGHGQMAGAVHAERRLVHGRDVRGQPSRVVARAGAIRAGDQDEQVQLRLCAFLRIVAHDVH